MGIFEGITHAEEIEELINSAQSMYNSAEARLTSQKMSTSKSLEELGKQKLDAWAGDMSSFLSKFGAFANVQMKYLGDQQLSFIDYDLTPNQLMVNMRTASVNASEVLKAGALSVGTGALVGIASYGGVMMFAKASTGTAIATLSGVAKKNATLAWFGGGSIKAGGLGMLGGKVVLAGVVLAPIAIVAGTIAAAKGKERLAEAKRVNAEAKKAVAQMETVITGLEGIERISEGYIELLLGLSKQFRPFLDEMESIARDYTPDADGKIDFNQLSEMEQKTLHLSWLLAQLYYHSLSKPILTEDGKVDSQASSMLAYSQKEYRQLSLDVTNLVSEKEKIKATLTDAKNVFSSISKKLEEQRGKSKKYFIKHGKNNIHKWYSTVNPFVETISKFENIDVANVFVSDCFNLEIENAFEKTFAVSASTRKLISNGISNVDEASLIEVAIGGMHILNICEEDILQTLVLADKGETTLWLQHGFAGSKEIVVAESLPFSTFDGTQRLLDTISGKENLSTAEYIKSEVDELVKLVEIAIDRINNGQVILTKQQSFLKRIGRLIALYRAEVERIYQTYQASSIDGVVDFEQLHEEERKVIQIACNLVKLYHILTDSKVFTTENNYYDVGSIDVVLGEAKNELRLLKKATCKMVGHDQRAADVMWMPEARNAFILNCVFLILVGVISILQIVNSNLFGLIGFAGMVIAFPKFFYYKNLSKSKLCFWRVVRLSIACIVVIGVPTIIRMV